MRVAFSSLLLTALPALCLASPINSDPTNSNTETATAATRTLVLERDLVESAGPEFDVYFSEDDEKNDSKAYRVTTDLTLDYQATITDTNDVRLADVNQELIDLNHVYHITVGDVKGTMTKCRICLSETWNVEFGEGRYEIINQESLFGPESFIYKDTKTSEVVATVMEKERFFGLDHLIITVNSTLPDGFFLATMAAEVHEDIDMV